MSGRKLSDPTTHYIGVSLITGGEKRKILPVHPMCRHRFKIENQNKHNISNVQTTVRIKSFRVTIFVVEMLNVLHIASACLYSYLSYLVGKAHAPYSIVICGLSDSYIFPCYLINGMGRVAQSV
jgi:hypothetical protein